MKKRDRRGGDFNMMCGNYNLFKGDKSDDCSKKTSPCITCLVWFVILEDLMFDVVCNTILRCGKQRVRASEFVVIHGSQDRIFQ